jgi:hypothetical protein
MRRILAAQKAVEKPEVWRRLPSVGRAIAVASWSESSLESYQQKSPEQRPGFFYGEGKSLLTCLPSLE